MPFNLIFIYRDTTSESTQINTMEDAPKAEGEGDKKIVHVYPLVKVSRQIIFYSISNNIFICISIFALGKFT